MRITAQLSSFALACPNLTALWLAPLWQWFDQGSDSAEPTGMDQTMVSISKTWETVNRNGWHRDEFESALIRQSINRFIAQSEIYSDLINSDQILSNWWWMILQIFGAFVGAGGFSHAFLDAAEKSLSQSLSRNFCGVIWCNLARICLISVHWNWNGMNSQNCVCESPRICNVNSEVEALEQKAGDIWRDKRRQTAIMWPFLFDSLCRYYFDCCCYAPILFPL